MADVTVGIAAAHNLADLAPVGACTASTADPLEVTLSCPADAVLTAPMSGRVVFVSGLADSSQFSTAPEFDPAVSWDRPSSGSPIVVIDHGPVGGHQSVMSVLNRVASLEPAAVLGQVVDPQTPLARAGEDTSWILLVDDRPFGAPPEPTPIYAVAQDLADAEALSERIQQPVDPICGFDPGALSGIPNASRGYRNGTHRGIDFGCVTRGQNAYAAMDGEVIVAVSDYADATPNDRNALLASTGAAGFTPRWTLNMLYGNYVIIQHEPVNDKETLTLYAHLEALDPLVVPGAPVTRGQRLGEIGNRGTNASAINQANPSPGNLHLHWEIFVGGTYLGAGKSVGDTQRIYTTLFG